MVKMYSRLATGLFFFTFLSSVWSLTNFYEKFNLGKRLIGHTLFNMTVRGPQMCIEECKSRKLCMSVNFNKKLMICELRTSTANKFPGELVDDPNFDYLDSGLVSYSTGDLCLKGNNCDPGKLCIKLQDASHACISDIAHDKCTAEPPYIRGTAINVTDRAVGAVLTYECLPDYNATGDNPNTTCRLDGSWSPANLTCDNGIETCFVDPNCIVKQDFTFDDSFNACYGDMYIKNSTYNPGKYVGIILCSPTRYHLFLSDDIDGMFYNIADGSGSGDDHCELVGGSSSTAIESPDYENSPDIQGFYRSNMNQAFSFGDIGYLGTSYNWFGTWLECGVTIPGDFIVY
ncbi:uncharacterized protein LOC134232853 [Saccostrea cucullata]|uniref:uncharacterized protein LOC134232853 n=1 Tax=Saccostrea cuccullata TaxID=36930 RepID=UPI002ED3FC73